MTETALLIFAILAAIIVGGGLRDEWRLRQHRRRRDNVRHIVGARPWWGNR